MYVCFRHLSVEYQSTLRKSPRVPGDISKLERHVNQHAADISSLNRQVLQLGRLSVVSVCQHLVGISVDTASNPCPMYKQWLAAYWSTTYRLNIGVYLLFAKFKPNMKSFASDISIDIMNVFLVE